MKKVKGAGENEPIEFALMQNYPNPFNPTTTIEYQLAAQSMTNIEVYNMLGERVVTLVNEVQPAGFYTVQWNGASQSGMKVATGVYFYRMRAGDFTTVKKMLLMK
jgi:flagellar hook assembly protein FlgD